MESSAQIVEGHDRGWFKLEEVFMRWILSWLAIVLVILVTFPAGAIDLAHQPLLDVQISLGNRSEALKFEPDRLQLQIGKRYRLHLINPSHQKHYFTAKDFADAIWSQKVDAGRVEVKGAIHELELRPDTEADWVFVPIRPGIYSLRCTIPGHTEAGMVGEITIEAT
ncbi:MAG: plastocyanin/azurin family copper-binding protein [Synechococcales bacterium]|nr:plastocyanin/azurin family copper-binding protein [Synechococcales bacterium]